MYLLLETNKLIASVISLVVLDSAGYVFSPASEDFADMDRVIRLKGSIAIVFVLSFVLLVSSSIVLFDGIVLVVTGSGVGKR